jgi:hypothetical protein
MREASEKIKLLLKTFFSFNFRDPACSCKGTLNEARM